MHYCDCKGTTKLQLLQRVFLRMLTKKVNEEVHELVANSSQKEAAKPSGDQSEEVVANCDHKNIDIKSMIRVIRGQQVMLDFDLAMLYGVKTSALNQAVKRNIGRFPDDFMFQLTKSELGLLKSQIAISKSAENQHDKVLISQIVTSKPIERRGGTQKPPFAFTRNGIGMLSSVLNPTGITTGF